MSNPRHVIVCGLHGLSIRIVEQLLLSGCSVTVIDNSGSHRFVEMLDQSQVTFLQKNPQLETSLREAGLGHASAVICTQVDDLQTLETALRVRELRPEIRLVVEFSNQTVGRALMEHAEMTAVFDMASLAGSAFVECCLGSSRHQLSLDGTNFEVIETTAKDATSPVRFRDAFGDLAPVAIKSQEGTSLCPGRDHLLADGDQVWLLGEPTELHDLRTDTEQTGTPTRHEKATRRLGRRLTAFRDEGNRSLWWMLLALTALMIGSAITIHLAYHARTGKHLDTLSSIYFAVETIGGIAFGDYSFATQSPWLKVFAIFEITTGLFLVTASFALFTNVLVSRRIERALGQREITAMSNHTIVVGLGSFGLSIVERLVAAGHRVAVVEKSEHNRFLARVRTLGVPILIADATQAQTLSMVNAREARSVAIATSHDLTNIEAGLAVRELLGERWGAVPVALRVFDRDLAQMMEAAFGFNDVLSTAAIAAPWFVSAALGLDVLASFSVDQQTMLVGKATISRGGGLEGLTMEGLSSRVRVVALRRAGHREGQLEYPPRRDTKFSAGDTAYLLGPSEDLLTVLQRDHGGGSH